MNRRDNLKLLLAGSMSSAIPAVAVAGVQDRVFVFDGRFAAARSVAGQATLAFDCQHDAAALWFASVKATALSGVVIDGLTTPADALVLGDCASREGLRCVILPTRAGDERLWAWTIARR
jgi:hypothetical protein